jgi:hypothetical protein
MEKMRYFLGAFIIITMMILPANTFAQDELVVEWSDGAGGVTVNALRDAILGDTTATGEQNPHVYKLKRGGLYHITDGIKNDGFPLVIVGETFAESGDATDYGPAAIQRVNRDDGSEPQGWMFKSIGDLTLRNVCIMGQRDDGVLTQYGLMKMQGDDTKTIFDNVIFDRNKWFYPHMKGENQDLIVTNCTFRNIHTDDQVWGGLAAEFTGPADTVIFENNTFVNIGGALYKAQNGPANYFRFNHNTVVNLARNFTWTNKNKFYAANNIFINMFWHGETNADFTNPDRIDPYSGVFSISDLPGAFGTNFGREIVLANNSNYRDPSFTNWYASPTAPDGTTLADPIAPQPFTNDTTSGWFQNWGNMVMADNHLNTDPGLTTPVPDSVIAKMKQNIVDNYNNISSIRYEWDDNRPASNIVPPWPLPIDFTYSNSTLMTAGTDGLPLGDLNWYPTHKATFEANKATYVAAIEDMATAPDLSIASTVQAEDMTLGTGATEYVVDGTLYYEMGDMGSISWDVTIADAGTYSLVVHNRAPHGTKGNHVKVNGVGLKNRSTNGEWMFDYTYPTDGTFLATVMSEDSLVGVEGTPLQLAAGTHTISIEKSWGWMEFGNVDVYSGDAAVGGTLLTTLAVQDAAAEGVTPAAVGASWVPEGFKGVTLAAGGSVSGTFDAADAGQYLARVYFASAGASDIEMMVNDVVASTIAVLDTGDAFSTFFGFNAGSNTLKFSSTAGGVTIDRVQFLLNNTVTAGVDDKPIIADGFVLRDAYPNPFNPSTKIEFTLPVDHRVNFAVYNIAGQRVKVLANEKFSAGTHFVKWNGTNSAGHKVSSGQYFCVMEYGKTVKVIKLTLMM